MINISFFVAECQISGILLISERFFDIKVIEKLIHFSLLHLIKRSGYEIRN